jgi:hypothetical protein
MARSVLHRSGMYKSVELAGFAAAQVVCCLFDKQPIVPLAFGRRAPDTQTVTILSGGNPEEIAAEVKQWLNANVDDVDEAVVAVDGYVTTPDGRKDAVILDLHSYSSPGASKECLRQHVHIVSLEPRDDELRRNELLIYRSRLSGRT